MATREENKIVNNFLKEVKEDCKNHDVSIKLLNTVSVQYAENIHCAGYFEAEPELVIKVAKKQKDWLPIFVHESCHFDQWKEEDPVWEYNNSCAYVDEWLQGEKVKNINKHIEQVQELELDCEKRTYNKIIKYNLPINPEEYIQKANVYVYMHTFVKQTRRWMGLIPPYKNPKIWAHAPKKFMKNYDVIPDKLQELFLDTNINF